MENCDAELDQAIMLTKPFADLLGMPIGVTLMKTRDEIVKHLEGRIQEIRRRQCQDINTILLKYLVDSKSLSPGKGVQVLFNRAIEEITVRVSAIDNPQFDSVREKIERIEKESARNIEQHEERIKEMHKAKNEVLWGLHVLGSNKQTIDAIKKEE